MSYNPTTDFLALLRSTSGGVRTELVPGLDFVVDALGRAGLISLFIGQTAPTVNPATTVWFKPAMPSSSAEGAVFLFNSTTSSFQTATPTLWSNLIAGPIVSLIPQPGVDAPLMDAIAAVGTSLLYSREDHVHPSDTSHAPIASPAFSGTPTAPTASLGDQTTKIATTAFVIANGGLPPPIGVLLPFAGSVVPNANWQFAVGQAVSRTGATATLFSTLGITFGSGDGTTTFNVPDMRGRVPAGVDGGANRLTSATMAPGPPGPQSLGATSLGGETFTIANTNLPPYTPSGTNGVPAITAGGGSPLGVASGTGTQVAVITGGTTPFFAAGSFLTLAATAPSFTGTAAAGHNSTPFGIVQPTIELNYILRVS